MSNSEEPRHNKRKLYPPHSSLLSMLPDEMVLCCLARVSRSDQAALSRVCKSHRSLVASPDLYRRRSLLGCTENCLYVCLLTPPDPIPRWFILCRDKSGNRLLSPIPSLPSQTPPEASSVVVLDWGIYVIGGLVKGKPTADVWLLDCRTHKWRSVPSMRWPRINAAAGVVDGKIFVMGGLLFAGHSHWGEVFDPKTQTWDSLPFGEELKLPPLIHGKLPPLIHGNVVSDHKVYAVDAQERTFYYSPREGKWGRGNRTDLRRIQRDWCMVENLIYCISRKGSIYWYDPKDLDWRGPDVMMFSQLVNGLVSLRQALARSRIVHFDEQTLGGWERDKILFGRTKDLVDLLPGAKLCKCGPNLVLFWDVIDGDRLEIWCAEISLEQKGGEVRGNIEWSNAVMTLDPFVQDHYKVMYSASVTL